MSSHEEGYSALFLAEHFPQHTVILDYLKSTTDYKAILQCAKDGDFSISPDHVTKMLDPAHVNWCVFHDDVLSYIATNKATNQHNSAK
jgi:hypothetical protein